MPYDFKYILNIRNFANLLFSHIKGIYHKLLLKNYYFYYNIRRWRTHSILRDILSAR